MTDDPEDLLLSELADLARQDGADKARFDERWDRLAAGTLTAEEEAELRALAETSPEAREAWEAFRPLGPEFQARVVDRIAGLPKEGRWARVLPFPPPARIGGWLTAAAAAAVAVFMLVRPDAPLPEYRIASVTGGTTAMRGEETGEPAPTFAPGDRIRVDLGTPTASDAGDLEARSYLLRDRELRPLELAPEIDESGPVRMKGTLDQDLQPGPWTLWVVVGRPGDLPDPAELRSLAGRTEIRQRDWIALSKDIRIQSRGP